MGMTRRMALALCLLLGPACISQMQADIASNTITRSDIDGKRHFFLVIIAPVVVISSS